MKTTGERSQVLTDVAVTETTEVWGREAVSYVSCSNNHEKADGLMADGVLEKSLSYVHTHEPPPTICTSNGIVNYTPAGSGNVLNKPVVLCQALVTDWPANRMVMFSAIVG